MSSEDPVEDQEPTSADQRDAEERERLITSNRIIAAFTIVLAVVGAFQVGLLAQQGGLSARVFDFTKKESRESSEEASRTRDILANQADAMNTMAHAADRQAQAAEKQVSAAEKQAAAAASQATAATDQARIASRELALRQITNLDFGIQVWPYKANGDFRAQAWVINRGDYTIRNVRVFVGISTATKDHDLLRVWSHLLPSPPFDSAPHGAGDTVNMPSTVLSAADWRALVNRDLLVVHAARFVFKDAAGVTQTQDRCVAYWGPPPGEVHYHDCQYEEVREAHASAPHRDR